ncbi:alpha/beta fold hydrolase [Aphanothece sacrum]|uniref:alpha/beta fold hydrolase n=1 Tax=Aphanothece sacrum TaxID=1122 RepID=UPI001561DBDE|nr:alpha/beta hydrolase [Aphanothece sacrum]
MNELIQFIFLGITTSYHVWASWRDPYRKNPPGQLIDMGGYNLHIYCQGQGDITVILDHSLGGIDGYFLIEDIAKITKVCIYDRGGYGWSDASPKKRCSQVIVQELDELLQRANIQPPYLLVGDSFGSYNMRLYAHYFPEKVRGLIFTDGLHEEGMLTLSPQLKLLKLFFISGFFLSIFGSILGLVRLLGTLKIFELIKPELKQFSPTILAKVKRSFYHYQHWLTMGQEMINLDLSGQQMRKANDLGDLPLISIKAKTFFKSSPWNFYLPLKAADQLRDKMQIAILNISSNSQQIQAYNSSHFVWIDEPEIIISAIKQLIDNS